MAFVLAFLLLLWCLLPQPTRWRGDEKFYTDAAIHMLQSGDYITPTYADGALRFNKPILTYWAVVLSFKTLGISILASRVPALLAGALLVWLTYRMARILLREHEAALGAAAIFASTMTTIQTSIRMTPDTLSALFVTASAYGFLRIAHLGENTARTQALAWLGAALAVATKGFVGLLPIAFALLALRVARQPGVRARDLFRPAAMLAALPVAAFWFALVIHRHGHAAWAGFFNDQIGSRIPHQSLGWIPANLLRYSVTWLEMFLPWPLLLLPALPGLRGIVRDTFRTHRKAFLLAALWYGLLVLLFTPATIQRTRYLIYAYPMVGVVYASVLQAIVRHPRSGPRVVTVLRALALLLAAGVALAGALLARVDARIAAGAAVLALWCLAVRAVGLRGAAPRPILAMSLLILGTYVSVDLFLRPVVRPVPSEQVAGALRWSGCSGRVALLGLPRECVSHIRVLSGGRVAPSMIEDAGVPNPRSVRAVVVAGAAGERYGAPDLHVDPPWTGRELLDAALAPDPAARVRGRRVPVRILTGAELRDFLMPAVIESLAP